MDDCLGCRRDAAIRLYISWDARSASTTALMEVIESSPAGTN